MHYFVYLYKGVLSTCTGKIGKFFSIFSRPCSNFFKIFFQFNQYFFQFNQDFFQFNQYFFQVNQDFFQLNKDLYNRNMFSKDSYTCLIRNNASLKPMHMCMYIHVCIILSISIRGFKKMHRQNWQIFFQIFSRSCSNFFKTFFQFIQDFFQFNQDFAN